MRMRYKWLAQQFMNGQEYWRNEDDKRSIVALITPMNEEGSVDYAGLEKLIQFHLDEQTDGLLVLGTTGESSTLTQSEEEQILQLTVKKVAGRVPVIAGAGTNNTKETIEKAKHFASLGADALLVITPYYNKTSDAGLAAHFTAIAEASPIPLILYNVPSRTWHVDSNPCISKFSRTS